MTPAKKAGVFSPQPKPAASGLKQSRALPFPPHAEPPRPPTHLTAGPKGRLHPLKNITHDGERRKGGLAFKFWWTCYMLVAELSLFTCFMSFNQSMMGQNQTTKTCIRPHSTYLCWEPARYQAICRDKSELYIVPAFQES